MKNKYYVYEWYIVETGEVFYLGKGCRNRYKTFDKIYSSLFISKAIDKNKPKRQYRAKGGIIPSTCNDYSERK